MGLSEADQARGLSHGKAGRVFLGHLALEQHRAGFGHLARDVVIVLPTNRHAVERAEPRPAFRALRRLGGLAARAIRREPRINPIRIRVGSDRI